MNSKKTDMLSNNMVFFYLALVCSAILAIPYVTGAPWTSNDFVLMGALLFGAGSIFIFIARKTKNNRLLAGLIVAAVFVWLWAELAVGIFTNWGS